METTLEDFVNGLPADKQKQMAVYFCRLALPIWEEWAKQDKSRLRYQDTVLYLWHKQVF